MNERIKELAKQAKAFIVEPEHASVGGVSEVSFDKYSDLAKFAELIVRECSAFVYNYPEKYLTRNQAREICMSMEEQFGVEETKGWVCPRCGVDRTKTVCPHGYTATIEGKCPMIGVAQ